MPSVKTGRPVSEKKLTGKRILSIYYRHKPGGLCKRLYMMFDALVAAGGEIHYIAVEPYPITHARIVPHILWTPFQKNTGLFFWSYFLLFAPFYAFYIGRKEEVHLVSVFGGIYGVVAVFLKILLQIPLLIFIRADGQKIGRVLHRAPLRLFLEDLFLKIAFSLADQLVVVSQPLKKSIATRYGFPPDKIRVLKNNLRDNCNRGRDRQQYRQDLALYDETFVVLTMAVLDARKNTELLIKVAHLLKQPALFLIVGDGPERNHLQRLANEVHGKAGFRFTGWQENVNDFLRASDLFVLPSKHEGCSNALLEALSFGLPCLTSDIDENRDILKSELLLFDVNDPASLSDKIEKMMIDPGYFEKVKLLSEDARKQLIFDWDHCIVQYHKHLLHYVNNISQ